MIWWKSMMWCWRADKSASWLSTLLLVLLLAWFLVPPTVLFATAGFGGYISEKLLGDGANEMLYLGSGTSLTVLGSSPVISTGPATSSSAGNIVTMTMAGDLQSLNGMPRADVWFRWWYALDALANTTVASTISSVGAHEADINPSAGSEVYYQFVASTDGISYGSIRSLPAVGGGHGISYWMLNTLLPIVIASIILISALALTRNPIVSLLASLIGLAGFYIVLALVSSL